jgi:hypothetical protein
MGQDPPRTVRPYIPALRHLSLWSVLDHEERSPLLLGRHVSILAQEVDDDLAESGIRPFSPVALKRSQDDWDAVRITHQGQPGQSRQRSQATPLRPGP